MLFQLCFSDLQRQQPHHLKKKSLTQNFDSVITILKQKQQQKVSQFIFSHKKVKTARVFSQRWVSRKKGNSPFQLCITSTIYTATMGKMLWQSLLIQAPCHTIMIAWLEDKSRTTTWQPDFKAKKLSTICAGCEDMTSKGSRISTSLLTRMTALWN